MSSCSKTPDIMVWYEKEGALDLPHIQGCADCQKEKESLADFYQATRELKNSLPAIPKNIERRLNRLSASSIILEATRRSLDFWAAVAKIESILLLLMGFALIALLGKIWQPVHEKPAQSMKEISMPAETLQKSAVSDLTENKSETVSSPIPQTEMNNPVEKTEGSSRNSQTLENDSSDLPDPTVVAQENQSRQQSAAEEPVAIGLEENSSASAELSVQDIASAKTDLKDGGEKTSEMADLSVEKDIASETGAAISSGEIQPGEAETFEPEPAASNESVQTASATLEPQSTQDSEIPAESGTVSEENEMETQEYTTQDEEKTSTDYSKVLESASDSLTTSVYQEKVNTPIFSHSEHYLTGSQNARSRSRPSMGVEWSPGMARMLPVFLGNGFILDKNESFHPLFKRALDEMNENRGKDASFSKPGNQTGEKKPLSNLNLSFKDALKNNQNLEIPNFEEDSENKPQMNASDVQAIHPEDKDNVSEWKTNSQKEDIKGKKFDHHPGISQEAIDKLGPRSKDKPHHKFHPPKEKGPKPPGGKAPKFNAPTGKVFNPPGSKTPIPPGGKGPPPPGGF
jgi:hypothetical protein